MVHQAFSKAPAGSGGQGRGNRGRWCPRQTSWRRLVHGITSSILSLWLFQLSEAPQSLCLILIYTQTHPTIPTLTPGPFPARAWIRGGPYNVALGSVHPLSTHTPPTLPSLQGRPSSHTLRGGLLLACPELHPPCPGLPHGEGGCSSQGWGGTAGRTQKRGQRPTYRILTWEPLRLCAEGETV